jgi:hypothetical protein
MTRALVVVPTHDHAALLERSVSSALSQTVEDLDIAIIGDGVDGDTRDVAADLERRDHRVRFLDLPKAGRTGEPHRHPVVMATDAELVTYLSDDDLLLPEHVEAMEALLPRADLFHPLPAYVDQHGVLHGQPIDLSDPAWVEIEMGGLSLVALTGLSHRASSYRRLPYGWRVTPTGRYTDHYMVQQFLAQPWCRAVTGADPTYLHFPSVERRDMTPAQRLAELDCWVDRLSTPGGRSAVVAEVRAAERRAGAVLRRENLLVRAGLDVERAGAAAERARHADVEARLAAEVAGARADAEALRLALDAAQRDRAAAEADAAARAHAHASAQQQLANGLRAAHEELAAMRASRTWRTRERLVQVRPVRALLARRRPGR